MNSRDAVWLLLLAYAGLPSAGGNGAEVPLRVIRESTNPAVATLRVRASQRSPHPIPRHLTGKFAEHLGWNIYNGMHAQVLRNPTFADYPFWTGQMNADGVTLFHSDTEKIVAEMRRQAGRSGWPASELDDLARARADGLACFWTRLGPRDAVKVSPDAGPHGGRAQRVETRAAGQGVAQWTWLPLHRARTFEFEVLARSPSLDALVVSLDGPAAGTEAESRQALTNLARATVTGLAGEWRALRGTLEVPAPFPAGAAARLAVTADKPGQFVLRHVFLRPADHVHGADPDVVRLLKESRLPLLRWPGGNFVSGYRWEDGIGPLERRPTRPNYAWGGVELNTFGTDEFIQFCRDVGCEPMICVNAGSGTPAEAARWVEYCNGPPTSPMGRLRATNGHPEPFRVKHWEVGNELWGNWQFYWTTASGYVDRFKQFAPAMLAADPGIRLHACGAPVFWGKDWNDTLIAGTASQLGSITDHPLIGGTVSPRVEPLDVYRDFMAVPEVLERKWAALRDDMRQAGVRQPSLAVTELQMFAHLGSRPEGDAPARLTHRNLVGQPTLTEGLYNVLIYHAAVRLGPFVEMVTHSATVNHGGGLRKERERVWAHPCHHAQAAFAAFAEATPVAVELETAMERAPLVLPDLRNATREASFGAVDALAALAAEGSLLLSVVHRGTGGPLRLAVELSDFDPAATAEARTLAADVPWAANTLEQADAVAPVDTKLPVRDRRLEVELRPFSFVRLRVPRR